MLKCFRRSRDRGPSKPEEKLPIIDQQDTKMNIGLIVGHNKGTSADTYNPAISEYMLNHMLIERTLEFYEGEHSLFGYTRNKDLSYARAMAAHASACSQDKIDLAIEFHLNAAGVPNARGYEALVKYGDNESAQFAHRFGNLFHEEYGIEPRGLYRGLRGVRSKKRGDRGYEFMNRMERKGIKSFIWEPCFCDYKTEESEMFLEPGRIDRYVIWLCKVLNKL